MTFDDTTATADLSPTADWERRQLADPDLPRLVLDTARGPHAALQIGTPDRGEVLLLPGFTGSKEDFAPILRGVAAAGYRATAIDLRGQFQTPGVRGAAEAESDYAPAELGLDVLAVLDGLDGPVHLVGHSFGGLVARSAVTVLPQAFRSLVLMDSGPSGVDEAQRERLDLLRPVLVEYGIEAVYQGMEMLAAAEEGYRPPAPELAEFLHTRFVTGSSVMLLGMSAALMGEPDRVGELRAAGVPTLVLHGRDEDVWLPPVQQDMAERLDAPRVVIPDAAHSPAADNAPATIEALVQFLNTPA